MEILARAVGRRKEAVAQVQLVRGTGQFTINEQPAEIYLQNNTFSLIKIKSPFEAAFSLDVSKREGDPNIDIESSNSSEKGMVKDIKTEAPTFSAFNQIDTIVKVKGGGLIGQADAIKLAVARALCQITNNSLSINKELPKNLETSIDAASLHHNQTLVGQNTELSKELRKVFKLKGLLTQDSRVKERRKYGLKKARKAPQYSKR